MTQWQAARPNIIENWLVTVTQPDSEETDRMTQAQYWAQPNWLLIVGYCWYWLVGDYCGVVIVIVEPNCWANYWTDGPNIGQLVLTNWWLMMTIGQLVDPMTHWPSPLSPANEDSIIIVIDIVDGQWPSDIGDYWLLVNYWMIVLIIIVLVVLTDPVLVDIN